SHQLDSALFNAYQSVELYKQLKDSVKIYKRSRLVTLILRKLGIYEEAELNAIESLSYLIESSNKAAELSNIYNDIAMLTKLRGNFKEALYWYDKALELTSNSRYQYNFKSNIALRHLG